MIIKKEVTSIIAFEYIRKQLISKKTLSVFLNEQNIESGKVYAYVPENIKESQLYNFNSGGLYVSEKKLINGSWLSEIINEATSNIKHIIRKYLNEDSQHCCIFEDCNRKPTDPRNISSKNEYTFIEDDVYYFFNKKNIDEERFEWVLNTSGGWYFLCVLSSLNQEDHNKWLPFTEISPILMDSVAKNVNVFFVEAYDSEGYLVWEKNDD